MRRKVAGAPSFAGPGRTILLIIQDASKQSSHAISSGFRFQRGGFPGLAAGSTFSRAFRLVSTFAGIVIGCIETGAS